jgi:imidazole glycerol-phosphate synthase subunit HisF
MVKIRVIPVLFLMNGLIVRSERFADFKIIGNPLSELERYSEWLADELVYVDITREGEHDIRRDDHKVKNIGDKLELLRAISKKAFMPLTFGGLLRSLEDIDCALQNGADKVLINSEAWRTPALITSGARKHGAQAMVCGMDVRKEGAGHAIYIDQGRTRLSEDLAGAAKRLEALGAGEIMVNSIDRDGTAEGYDVEAIRKVAVAVSIPVIACGGVGDFSDFRAAIDDGKASAVAAGNIFHFTEHSYKRAKSYLRQRRYNVRYPYEN